jgi:hypothetical protein
MTLRTWRLPRSFFVHTAASLSGSAADSPPPIRMTLRSHVCSRWGAIVGVASPVIAELYADALPSSRSRSYV